jgi:hypothetical protein
MELSMAGPRSGSSGSSVNMHCLNTWMQCPVWAAVSTGRRNTLVFLERWSVSHGLSEADIFLRKAEGRDLGSVAARDLSPKFPPALRGVLGVRSLALSR